MRKHNNSIRKKEVLHNIECYKRVMQNRDIHFRINIKSNARYIKNQYEQIALHVRYGWALDFLL